MELWSAGHSNRSAAELVALLAAAGIACVADVRRFPVSRRFPQHSRAPLEKSLAAARIGYAFLGDALGGRREPSLPPERSRNAALPDPALRAFADALGTPELEAGLERLEALARARADRAPLRRTRLARLPPPHPVRRPHGARLERRPPGSPG